MEDDPGGPESASLSEQARAFLEASRVGHLATASAAGEPHVVPVCFAVLDPTTLVFAIDDKPKRRGRPLRRVRNLLENPRFALVVDHWSEDWQRLGYVLAFGRGDRCADPRREATAIAELRRRYPQYIAMDLAAGRHDVIELHVERVHVWGQLGPDPRRRRHSSRRRATSASAP